MTDEAVRGDWLAARAALSETRRELDRVRSEARGLRAALADALLVSENKLREQWGFIEAPYAESYGYLSQAVRLALGSAPAPRVNACQTDARTPESRAAVADIIEAAKTRLNASAAIEGDAPPVTMCGWTSETGRWCDALLDHDGEHNANGPPRLDAEPLTTWAASIPDPGTSALAVGEVAPGCVCGQCKPCPYAVALGPPLRFKLRPGEFDEGEDHRCRCSKALDGAAKSEG